MTVGLYYTVKSGREEEFEAYFGRVKEHLASVQGHVATRLYRDVEESNSYLIYSEWETREDFERFRAGDAFKAAKEWGRDSILARPPRHTVFG